MKSKSFNKKLSLNKKTVANINESHMNNVKGGETTLTCGACKTIVSCWETQCKTCITLCEACYTQDYPC